MEYISNSLQKTQEIALDIARKLKSGDVLALSGDLGSGKTTFVGFLVDALQSHSRTQSPTFVILRKYTANLNGIKNVNHLDLYRLQSQQEIDDLGLVELFTEKNTVSLIEWPDFAEKYLPANTIRIKFEYVDESTRKMNVQNLY
ncbi:MAG TPA: tRNA (adenosine(37)-N6)-threonylcarbamoyltransferase complex ATPase subunit type 1 TsaE [Candidatus Saccharimonadales bacterium]|nr:tRNA (adenosine(37)-N6)-threonylcarbamoyltransferase complex ATPase subunit type 1 TsaE [Candidatus Saccharimonadales bacterium]